MTDIKNIRNVVFDLGGVIIDIQRSAAEKALEQLGIVEAPDLLGEYEQKGVFLLLEEGRIADSEMYDSLLALCRPGTTCTDVMVAFEKFLVGVPVERLRMVDAVRKAGYKTFVLSNTNPIFYNNWIAKAFRQDGKTINDYFDGIVVSFQELMCKPNPQIFKNLLNRYELKPEQTLFLDDSQANCTAAEGVGIKSVRITPEGETSLHKITEMLTSVMS